jgi:hypothetical protein
MNLCWSCSCLHRLKDYTLEDYAAVRPGQIRKTLEIPVLVRDLISLDTSENRDS